MDSVTVVISFLPFMVLFLCSVFQHDKLPLFSQVSFKEKAFSESKLFNLVKNEHAFKCSKSENLPAPLKNLKISLYVLSEQCSFESRMFLFSPVFSLFCQFVLVFHTGARWEF